MLLLLAHHYQFYKCCCYSINTSSIPINVVFQIVYTFQQGLFHVNTTNQYLLHKNAVLLYVGESGVVYKGYIDTSLGSELVAVKTGKGIKNCAGLDTCRHGMCMLPL